MRQVDGAGFKVDESHGDALPLQSGKLVEVHRAELAAVFDVVWFRPAEREDEVLLVEGRYLFLQLGQRRGRCRYFAVVFHHQVEIINRKHIPSPSSSSSKTWCANTSETTLGVSYRLL